MRFIWVGKKEEGQCIPNAYVSVYWNNTTNSHGICIRNPFQCSREMITDPITFKTKYTECVKLHVFRWYKHFSYDSRWVGKYDL